MVRTHHKLILLLATLLFTNCSLKADTYVDVGMKTGIYEDPSWSPDGETIVVQFAPDGNSEALLVQIEKDGNDWNELTTASPDLGPSSNPIWIDKNTIVFTRSDVDLDTLKFSSELVSFDLIQKIEDVYPLPAYISEMSLDSTNRRIALAYNYAIGLYDINTGDISDLVQYPGGRVEHVAFDPSGKRLAYTTAEDKSYTRYFTLEVMDLETNKHKTLLDRTIDPVGSLSWSPDGQWIALRQVSDEYQSSILLIKPDGSEKKSIEFDFAQPADISWDPSGNMLAMTSIGQPGQNSLYLVDLTPWLK